MSRSFLRNHSLVPHYNNHLDFKEEDYGYDGNCAYATKNRMEKIECTIGFYWQTLNIFSIVSVFEIFSCDDEDITWSILRDICTKEHINQDGHVAVPPQEWNIREEDHYVIYGRATL